MNAKRYTCGDYGGINGGGEPCGAVAGKGTPHLGIGRCEDHPDTSPFANIQHPKKRAFLAAFVHCGGNVTRACEQAGIDRTTPYSPPWKEDPEFQAAWESAKPLAAEVLESEAIRRAYEGVRKPYVHGGTVARDERGEPIYLREYSDTLMIFLLKGAMPEKHVDRREISGPEGGPIRHAGSLDLRQLSDDELGTLEQLMRRAAVTN